MTSTSGSGLGAPAIPYRGIAPFRYADHAIFFAREEETRQLASLVTVYRGVFLYGDSGNGKSSLINAGLLPHAREVGYEPILVRVQPRGHEELVVERIATSDDGAQLLPCRLAPAGDDATRIVLSVAEFTERLRRSTSEARPLIVFDQFEEIITLFEDGTASRDAVAEMIVELLSGSLPVKLRLAFREDYLGAVKHLLAACPELVDQAVRLGAPVAAELDTIIRGPFERFPGHFERELEPALAARLGTALAERFGAGEVSLSEVQTVCLRLWHSPDPDAALTEKGVQGLLEDDLGEALTAFAPDVRAAAVALLSHMVTASGTRNVVSAEDLRQRVRDDDDDLPVALVDEALDRLERESKLVRRERRRDVDTYEITSEFLVPWISARRAELQSERDRARDRRRLRILGALAGGMLVVTAIVAALAIWALHQRDDAQHQRAEARRQTAQATSLALTSIATPLASTRPDVSLLLALAAAKEHPGVEARSSAIRALLAARDPAVVAILHGHTDQVASVAFSADGRTLASGSQDATIRLWDVRTHRQIGRPLTGHADEVTQLAFSPTAPILASAANQDSTVRLWDTRTHKQIGRPLKGYQLDSPPVFSPDGRTLALFGIHGVVLVDVGTRKTTAKFGLPGLSKGLAFSRDGRFVVAASDEVVTRWDVRARRRVESSPIANSTIQSDVAIQSSLRSLAYSDEDGQLRNLDARTGRERGPRLVTRGFVFELAFTADDRVLAGATTDGLAVWDWRTHKPLGRALTGHAGTVVGVATSPDGHTIATAGGDHTVRLWDLRARSRDQLRSVLPRRDYASVAAFAPDASILAIANRRALHFENTVSGRQRGASVRIAITRLLGRPDAAFSANGRMAISSGREILVVAVATGSVLKRIRPRARFASGVLALSPNGRTVAVTDFVEGTVLLIDARTGKPLGRPLKGSSYVQGLTFSADGRTLAVASNDRLVHLWDVRTHKRVGKALAGHTAFAESTTFSPDGRILASTSYDGTIRLWDVRTHRQLGAPLTGHSDVVRAATFSPDGRTLASTGDDGTARLWDVRTHQLLGTLRNPGSGIIAVTLDSGGRTVLTVDFTGKIRRWRGLLWRTTAELEREVCHFVGGSLSRDEWQRFASGVTYRRTCP